MEKYIELFQENGGPELFIKAKDYEREIDAIELENLMNPNEELLAEKEEIQARKEQASEKLHKEIEEKRESSKKNTNGFTIELSDFDSLDVTENYFSKIMNNAEGSSTLNDYMAKHAQEVFKTEAKETGEKHQDR